MLIYFFCVAYVDCREGACVYCVEDSGKDDDGYGCEEDGEEECVGFG